MRTVGLKPGKKAADKKKKAARAAAKPQVDKSPAAAVKDGENAQK